MADTYQVLNLAAIIREVDGSNNKGAAALAESILDHPRFRAALADEPAVPAPPADGEVAELVEWLHEQLHVCLQAPWTPGIKHFGRAAELLQRQALVPVSVSERPWEREGWCDVEGRFWAEHISRSGVASWRCAAASDLGGWAVRCLPAHALPQPEVGE